MLRVFLLSVPVLIASNLFAQSHLKDSTALRRHSKAFMEELVKGEVGEAFSSFKEYSRLPDKEADRLASKLKGQLSDYESSYGELIDQHALMEDHLGAHLMERVHILRYEDQPVRFHFIYYRSDEGWILTFIRWKDTVKGLFGH